MIAFEVRRNGQLLCTAGHYDISVLIAAVNFLAKSQYLSFSVGGLTQGARIPRQHLDWLSESPLSLGDEVSVKIVDVPTCDAPKETKPAQ
jgi:hypothetical protein